MSGSKQRHFCLCITERNDSLANRGNFVVLCLADARRNFEKNSWNPKRESYCFYCWPLTQHFSAEIILKGNVTSSRKGQVVWNLREFQQETLEIFQHALTFIKRRNISQWLVAGAIAQGEELCDGRIDWNNCAVDGSVGFVWVCLGKGKKSLRAAKVLFGWNFFKGLAGRSLCFFSRNSISRSFSKLAEVATSSLAEKPFKSFEIDPLKL